MYSLSKFAALFLSAVLVPISGLAQQPTVASTEADQPQPVGRAQDSDSPEDALGAAGTLPSTAETASIPSSQGLEESTAAELFLKANDLYQQGQYDGAASSLQALVDAGFASSDLHYNLANARLRSGELGRAVAGYLRALELSPRDQDARANLEFARQSRRDPVPPPEPPAWIQTLAFWHFSLSLWETLVLGAVAGAFFWLFVAMYLVRSRWRPLWLLTGSGLVFALLLGSYFVRTQLPTVVAVVLPGEASVYSGTDAQSRVIFNLHAGTELLVATTDPAWTQFLMPDGQPGWIPTEQVELVGQN